MSGSSWDAAAEAAAIIRERLAISPTVAVVLGSGLAGFVDALDEPAQVPFAEIPHWPVPNVAGHPGRLIASRIGAHSVAVLQGRGHLYEGFSPQQLAIPIQTLAHLGVRRLIVTNTAGGLNPAYRPGDLMLIEDHIGLPNLAGFNPLRGSNDPAAGPRFPDLTGAYDPDLIAIARAVASDRGITVRQGTYIWVAGPSYETPAEVRMLRMLGADAVGMSTVPEVITARHAGMSVLGISCITNALSAGPSHVDHVDVVAVAARATTTLTMLLLETINRLPAEEASQ